MEVVGGKKKVRYNVCVHTVCMHMYLCMRMKFYITLFSDEQEVARSVYV